MRRVLFPILGILELAVAFVLVSMGRQLPANEEIDRGFQSAHRVTDRAHAQIYILRRQVQDLRRPELQQLARGVRQHTKEVTASLRGQHIDFDTLRTMHAALGEIATGLDSLASTLDPAGIRRLGEGLGETADFLDKRVVPSAAEAADHLDASTKALRADARRLAAVLRQTPLDLKAAREIHEGLGRFGEGLDKLSGLLQPDRLKAMRDGFRGMEESLRTGAGQVERLAGYTYPVVTFNGIKPEVEQRPFWPEGGKIAAGMRQAAAGTVAAGKQVDGLTEDLPKLRASLEESRQVVTQTRRALAAALEQQEKVGPLLQDVPQRAAQLAEDLPKASEDLCRILRDTERLKMVAQALRQARAGIDGAASRWPELQTTLAHSAKLLRATRDQLDVAIEHRPEYEASLRQSIALAESFALMLPLLTDQLDARLDEEERALHGLGQSLEEVQTVLPAYHRTTAHLVQSGRILAWLVAAIAGLHGCYLMLSVQLGRRYSL